MGIKETILGKVEEYLNNAVDTYLDASVIKEELHLAVDKLVDNNLMQLKHKLKADVIDRLDGEDDIQ